jgi:hypothetical protein
MKTYIRHWFVGHNVYTVKDDRGSSIDNRTSLSVDGKRFSALCTSGRKYLLEGQLRTQS